MAITPMEAEERHKTLVLKELKRAADSIDEQLIKHSNGALYRLYNWHSVDHCKRIPI